MACPNCSASVPDGARFCPSCGYNMALRPDERRVVTVLFADLVGFTTLSESMDPEQLKNLVDGCFQRLVADVVSFGGQVDKILGDAIMALFGAPVAHEDDAERAVRAALRMQTTVAEHSQHLGIEVRLRIGVNTGEVLVGALRAGGDYTAMGDVVNTAQRLQTAAQPGHVLVGPATHAATHEVIRYDHLGPIRARGRDEPVEAWCAIETLAPPGRRPRRQRAEFVGRTAELGLLSRAVSLSAERSRALVAVVYGEAGVGKTRLAEEAAELAESQFDAALLEGRCVPYGEANSWWALAEAVRAGCGIGSDDDPVLVELRLRGAVAATLEEDTAESEIQRLVDGLLHLLDEPGPLDDIDPARAREEVIRSLSTYLRAYCRVRPVVLVLSDLHWADDLLLELIDRVVVNLSAQPLALLATARSGFEERWHPQPGRHNVITINLDPLDRTAAAELLATLVDDGLAEPAIARMLDRSGGNPLFIEELASFVAQSGSRSELPDSLRGLVAARLDALAPHERASLEDAAVLGRAGPVNVLVRIADQRGPIDGKTALSGLVAKELLVLDGDRWSFHSEAVREVAYNTLTKASRARRHATIGALLADDSGLRRDEGPEPIANHYTTAAELICEMGAVPGVPGDVRERALEWLGRACERAHKLQMVTPALRMAQRGLALLGDEPVGPKVRIDLAADLGKLRRRLLLVRAWARSDSHHRDLPAARDDLDVVLAEARTQEDRWAEAAALGLLGELEQLAGQTLQAEETLGLALARWREIGDAKGASETLRNRGMGYLLTGRFPDAEHDFLEALDLARSVEDRRGEAWATQQLAWISFARGDTVEADGRIAKAAATFRALKDNVGLGWSNGLLAWVRFQQGRADEADALAAQVAQEAESRRDSWAQGMMYVLQGFIRTWSGRSLDGIALAERARQAFRSIDDQFGQVQASGALARAAAAAGRRGDADRWAEESFALSRGTGLENFVHVMTAGLAAHVGDPRRALAEAEVLEGHSSAERLGVVEWFVHLALAHLQNGEAEEAEALLEEATLDESGSPDNAYARAVRTLVLAATGRATEAVAAADTVLGLPGASYLDRFYAQIARAGALAQLGDQTGALTQVAQARLQIEQTDDEIMTAVVRLVEAEIIQVLGLLGSDPLRREADALLTAIEMPAEGWRRVALSVARGSRTPTALVD